MKKGKLALVLVSLFAITNAAACNISFDRGSSVRSLKSIADVSENLTSSDNGTDTSSDGGETSSDHGSDSSEIINNAELISISLDSPSLTLQPGTTATLRVSYNPTNAAEKGINWSTQNSGVATVDDNGVVTAVELGTTTIKATSVASNAIYATCTVSVIDNVILSGVDAKQEFVLFEQHKAVDSSKDNGFYDRTQRYKVGDDNNFNVKPSLSVLDKNFLTPVSASSWAHDFTIKAKLNGQEVGDDYFTVTNPRECDVKFTSAAVGKTFTISVAPGGVDAETAAEYTRTLTVDVVDGYNVYNAKELGYFDNREPNSTDDAPTLENDQKWQNKWHEFKAANGMDPNYQPAALILQKDIKVTTADLPSNFFYTAAEASSFNDEKAAGSLIDDTYLYARSTHTSITVDGNYFSLDLSQIPLVVRERGKTTEVGAVVSHAAAFKANRGEDIKFQNINMSGNARNAVNDDDKKFGGGFIFVKGAGSKTLTAYNIIATKFFITFMGEKPHYEDSYVTAFALNKVKCYNNYNSFLYNWGSSITAKDTLFRSCGGPIVIQDHTSTNSYENKDADDNYLGTKIDGYAPTTSFIDCTLDNYVAGTEAWFIQFNALQEVIQIKQLSDLMGATGLPKSYIVNEAHEGKLYQVLAGQAQASFFNFIAFNKSGTAQGLTNVPCCGTVNIQNSGVTTTYNYRQPAYDAVCVAYTNWEEANHDEASTNALIAAALANGIIEPTDSQADMYAKIGAHVTPILTEHATLRKLNSFGLPIIDLGPKYDLVGWDGKNTNPYLQNISSIADEYLKGQDPVQYQPTAEQLTNTPDYGAIYYNGMMLVVELKPYVM